VTEIGDGTVVVLFVAVGEAARVIGAGEVRIELDRRAEIGNGPVEIVLFVVGMAALIEGVRSAD
jgi:hypothetical protein